MIENNRKKNKIFATEHDMNRLNLINEKLRFLLFAKRKIDVINPIDLVIILSKINTYNPMIQTANITHTSVSSGDRVPTFNLLILAHL